MRAGGPYSCLLQEVFERYRRPLYLTETSHVGDGRAAWLHELSDEVHVAAEGGVPILGVCLYPIVDRCGWDDPRHWHNSGLWDLSPDRDGRLRRIVNREYAAVTRVCAGPRCAGGVMNSRRGPNPLWTKRSRTMPNKTRSAE